MACDRVDVGNRRRYDERGIRFQVEDLAQTTYGSSAFATVSCVSVIEHGVELGPFFLEMHRVLKPGGVLALSTDYWPDPTDCYWHPSVRQRVR